MSQVMSQVGLNHCMVCMVSNTYQEIGDVNLMEDFVRNEHRENIFGTLFIIFGYFS